MDTVAITIQDLEDAQQILGACLTYFQAQDLQNAQLAFNAPRPSPLTMEIEQMHGRFRGYMGDYLLRRYEAELEEDDAQVEEDAEESPNAEENGQEGFVEAIEEELPAAPLGEFSPPRQEGRVLKPEEI